MEPRLELLPEKKLVGKRLTISLTDNRTGQLWGSFMPKRNTIHSAVEPALYSLQVYPPSYFEVFNADNTFEKWAAVEVRDYTSIPEEMETFTLPQGLYAVFQYKGLSTDNAIYQYIFTTWLPHSDYALDNRPHFERLGEKYRNNDPDSEEEIWIPVKRCR